MESDSEDEVFFGSVTAKEEKQAEKFRNRKTEVFVPQVPLFRHPSSEYVLCNFYDKLWVQPGSYHSYNVLCRYLFLM